jgi:hypothetical protein
MNASPEICTMHASIHPRPSSWIVGGWTMDEWMNGKWMDGWMDGWMDEWMDEWIER